MWFSSNSWILKFACAFTFSLSLVTHAQPSPNIVIVFADDLGMGDLGCYNPESKIPTPHADRLAAGGVRFTDAHSPSAVCTPSRYALLTGRYAWRTRLKSWTFNGYSTNLFEPGRSTIASMLADRGYETAAVGKWHLGLGSFDPANPGAKTDYDTPIDAGPLTVGFTRSFIFPASLDMPPYVYLKNDVLTEPPSAHTPGSKRRWSGGGGFWRAGAMGETFDFTGCLPTLTDEAVRAIEESAETGKPFMLYFPLTGPHTPWVPREEWEGASEAGWYGDFVAECDHSLGRVLDALDRMGVADDTIVVYTSDNGSHWRPRDEEEFDHLANLHYRGMKADIYEAGHRVPLIVRWPGVTPGGSESHGLVGLVDFYATVAEVLGAEVGEGQGPDSVSLASLLRDPAGPEVRDHLVHHSGGGMFAIRRGDWKLIEGLGSGGFTHPQRRDPEEGEAAWKLFNLGVDPGEMVDRSQTDPDIAAELLALLDRVRDVE